MQEKGKLKAWASNPSVLTNKAFEGIRNFSEKKNPFFNPELAKIVYVIDWYSGLTKGELDQFFRILTDEETRINEVLKKKDPKARQWRSTRIPDATLTKRLESLQKLDVIEVRKESGIPRTFDQDTWEVFEGIVKRESGLIERKPSVPAERYFLNGSFFSLLTKYHGIKEMIEGNYSFEKNKQAFEKSIAERKENGENIEQIDVFNNLQEIKKASFNDPLTLKTAEKKLGISFNEIKTENPELFDQAKASNWEKDFQPIIQILQNYLNSGFSERLAEDFEKYYFEFKKETTENTDHFAELRRIAEKQNLSFEYWHFLMLFLQYSFAQNTKNPNLQRIKRRYNYAENLLLGFLTCSVKGFIEGNSDQQQENRINELRKSNWARADKDYKHIEMQFKNTFKKRLCVLNPKKQSI